MDDLEQKMDKIGDRIAEKVAKAKCASGKCPVWLDANTLCRELELASRMGWRLPTVEELSSLVDPRQAPLALPPGHPFLAVQYGSGVPAYWTASNAENPAGADWFVNLWRGAGPHLAGLGNKSIPGHVWPVRGGASGVNWNW